MWPGVLSEKAVLQHARGHNHKNQPQHSKPNADMQGNEEPVHSPSILGKMSDETSIYLTWRQPTDHNSDIPNVMAIVMYGRTRADMQGDKELDIDLSLLGQITWREANLAGVTST